MEIHREEEVAQETRRGATPAGKLGGVAEGWIRGGVWSCGDGWRGVRGLPLHGEGKDDE